MEHLKSQVHISFISFTVYLMLPSLADGTVQVVPSMVHMHSSICSNFNASLCRLFISDILCVYFPFSNFVSCSNILSHAILKSTCKENLSFCYVCVANKLFSKFYERIQETTHVQRHQETPGISQGLPRGTWESQDTWTEGSL